MEMGSDHAQRCDDHFLTISKHTRTKITELKRNVTLLDMQQHAAKSTTDLLIYRQVKVLSFVIGLIYHIRSDTHVVKCKSEYLMLPFRENFSCQAVMT